MANLVKGPPPRVKRSPKMRARFLDAIKETGNITLSCKMSRLPSRTAYDWRRQDEQFRQDWDDALVEGEAKLEDEAKRRALLGVKKPIYQGGKRVGYVQEYSDTLLIFLLKGTNKAKFGDRTMLAGDKDNPVQVSVLDSILKGE